MVTLRADMGPKEARPGRDLLSGCFLLGLETAPSLWTCSAAQSEQAGEGPGWQGDGVQSSGQGPC